MSQPARATSSPGQNLKAGLERAMLLRAEGQGREALSLCEALARTAPRHADLQHLLGILAFEGGSHQAAKDAIDRAIRLAPERADFFSSRGIVCRALGDRAGALEAFRSALRLAPGLAEGHNNLGGLLLDADAREAAVLEFREALRLQPGYADATLNLALALAPAAEGRAEALERFRGLLGEARLGPAAFNGLIELAAWLDDAALPAWLGDVVRDRLASTPAIPRALEALSWRLVLAGRSEPGDAPLGPLARLVLARCLATSPTAERFVIERRRRALALATEDRPLSPEELDDIAALALQANLSSHVQSALERETGQVARLQALIEARIEAGEAPAPDGLALYAVFAPLAMLEGAERLATLLKNCPWPASLHPLLRRGLIEPLIERAIALKVQTLGPIADATSERVGAQYEAHPYPRWIAIESGPKRPLGALLREHLPAADVPAQLDGPVELMIAGCGTGWSVVHAALTYQGAHVIGLDLSRSSIAYAWREVAARKLDNVALVQGDILEAGRLGRRFDYVVSGGVLHHMADPLAGWRALIECLAPHGLMQIGLYSELGRRSIVAARQSIEASGVSIGAMTSDDAIRAFRQRVLDDLPGGALEPLTRFADFYDLNGCRDLLFNEVEHRFDLVRLDAALEHLGLEFLGFNLASPEIGKAYRQRFPDDAPMRSLGHWHVFENENPDTFAAMYQFWCRRRPAEERK